MSLSGRPCQIGSGSEARPYCTPTTAGAVLAAILNLHSRFVVGGAQSVVDLTGQRPGTLRYTH